MTTDEQPLITLGSGTDGRIVAEFLSKKTQIHWYDDGIPGILLELARKHKRSVQEIKALCRAYQEQQSPGGVKTSAADAQYKDRVCSCGEAEGIKWASNPYSAEICGNFTKRWICPACYHNSAMDI